MTSPLRHERLADALLHEVSALLVLEINDPRVRGVTLTRSKLSKDLRLLRLYYTLHDYEKKKEVQAGLIQASGFIKRELSHRMDLKFVPQLEFFCDETERLQERTLELLQTGPKCN